MKRLAALTVLGLVLALAPANLRAADTFQGHYDFGDAHFTPTDAFAVKTHDETILVFSDFALDRQAILDTADGDLVPFETQAKAAKGRYVALSINYLGCSVESGLAGAQSFPCRTSSLKSDGRRVKGTCAGRYLRGSLDFSFTVDLPVSVPHPPTRIDPKAGEQAVVVQALMSALAASDWDTARRYLPKTVGPPYFATPEIKESFFRGVARNYPRQMALDEGWVRGSETEALFTGTTVDGAPIQRGRVKLQKMDGTWRVLRPYPPGASLPWWWGSR